MKTSNQHSNNATTFTTGRMALLLVVVAVMLHHFGGGYQTPDLEENLIGKTALVTGASRGLGKGYALGLAEAGAALYLTATTEASAEKTCVEARKLGATYCKAFACNNENDDEIEALYRNIEADLLSNDETEGSNNNKRLDIVVNNAFNTGDTHKYAGQKFWDKGEYAGHLFDIMTKVGLRSHYVSSVYAMKLMTKLAPVGASDRGLIVFTSSGGGMNYFVDVAYGVGKAAVDRMAADMAIETESENITVVSTWPGWVDTEQVRWEIAQGKNGTFGKIKKGAGATSEGAFEFLASTVGTPLQETILLNGRTLAALAKDKFKAQFSGKVLPTSSLSTHYDVVDEKNWRTPAFFTTRFMALLIFPNLQQVENLPWVLKYIPDIRLTPQWLQKVLNGSPRFM
ncbi:Dehydrogenase/reductase SDR family member 1 [Seminavis robusta]|uniref:Dehydrogenase/reductase SDR family member 1 n=1 Tax=Seminavis robusta TaxID=568900 RepID=A0A9N8E9Y3_9STRA|nr:Dehydrogenase/reductase SDR family member 1 [Seminavis robusta]|eukprot:Sro670_g184680.1 Dehydrogenase/reductase SDR family member 1 (399) ;mRNA; r:24366-25562